LASRSFKCALIVDEVVATPAVFVVFLGLFAPDFRCAVLTDRFVTPVVPVLFRFRFRSFALLVFALTRAVFAVLGSTRDFDAGLPLPARFRGLDKDAALERRFGADFARDNGPVFFVFELVGFLGLLRATIVNLSTREHHRIRS